MLQELQNMWVREKRDSLLKGAEPEIERGAGVSTLRCSCGVYKLFGFCLGAFFISFRHHFSQSSRSCYGRSNTVRTCGNIYLAVDISFFAWRESLEIAQRKWVEAHLVPHQGVQDLFCGLYAQLSVVLRPLHLRLSATKFWHERAEQLVYFFNASCSVLTPAALCLIASRSSRPLFTLALKDRLRLKAPVISPPPTTWMASTKDCWVGS